MRSHTFSVQLVSRVDLSERSYSYGYTLGRIRKRDMIEMTFSPLLQEAICQGKEALGWKVAKLDCTAWLTQNTFEKGQIEFRVLGPLFEKSRCTDLEICLFSMHAQRSTQCFLVSPSLCVHVLHPPGQPACTWQQEASQAGLLITSEFHGFLLPLKVSLQGRLQGAAGYVSSGVFTSPDTIFLGCRQ